MPSVDQLDPVAETAELTLFERFRVPAELLIRLSRQEQVVDELRPQGQLGEAAGVAQELDQTVGHSACWQVPRVVDAVRYVRHGAQGGQQRARVVPLDGVGQELRLVLTKLEGGVILREVVGGWREFRPHRPRSPRRVAVIVAFGLESPESGCPLAVLGEAEV